MKYQAIYNLQPGESTFIVSLDLADNKRIRQAVWAIRKHTKMKLRTSERFEDIKGRTETDRGFCEKSAVLGTRVYRKE